VLKPALIFLKQKAFRQLPKGFFNLSKKDLATWALFHRASFVDSNVSAAEFGSVEHFNRFVSIAIVFEFNETEAFTATGHPVGDYRCRSNGTSFTEMIFELIARGRPWKATNEKFLGHD